MSFLTIQPSPTQISTSKIPIDGKPSSSLVVAPSTTTDSQTPYELFKNMVAALHDNGNKVVAAASQMTAVANQATAAANQATAAANKAEQSIHQVHQALQTHKTEVFGATKAEIVYATNFLVNFVSEQQAIMNANMNANISALSAQIANLQLPTNLNPSSSTEKKAVKNSQSCFGKNKPWLFPIEVKKYNGVKLFNVYVKNSVIFVYRNSYYNYTTNDKELKTNTNPEGIKYLVEGEGPNCTYSVEILYPLQLISHKDGTYVFSEPTGTHNGKNTITVTDVVSHKTSEIILGPNYTITVSFAKDKIKFSKKIGFLSRYFKQVVNQSSVVPTASASSLAVSLAPAGNNQLNSLEIDHKS